MMSSVENILNRSYSRVASTTATTTALSHSVNGHQELNN